MVNDARAFSPKLQGNRRQMLCCLFHKKLSDRDTSRTETLIIPLFQQLLAEPDIIDGHYDIHWLEHYLARQA